MVFCDTYPKASCIIKSREKTSLTPQNFSMPVAGLALCQKNDSWVYVSKTVSGKKKSVISCLNCLKRMLSSRLLYYPPMSWRIVVRTIPTEKDRVSCAHCLRFTQQMHKSLFWHWRSQEASKHSRSQVLQKCSFHKSYVASSLDTLESSFEVFELWLPSFGQVFSSRPSSCCSGTKASEMCSEILIGFRGLWNWPCICTRLWFPHQNGWSASHFTASSVSLSQDSLWESNPEITRTVLGQAFTIN